MPGPIVGTGVIIIRAGRVLLGKRKGKHGYGTWSPPGGKLEFNETFEGCCMREVLEETGMSIRNIRQLAFTNNVFADEGVHSVTLFFTVASDDEPRLCERDKFEQWQWFELDKLPSPLFLPLAKLIKEGKLPSYP